MFVYLIVENNKPVFDQTFVWLKHCLLEANVCLKPLFDFTYTPSEEFEYLAALFQS